MTVFTCQKTGGKKAFHLAENLATFFYVFSPILNISCNEHSSVSLPYPL